MKARKRAGTVGKVLGCALLLVIALFPIYWLVAMAIRPTSEMQGATDSKEIITNPRRSD